LKNENKSGHAEITFSFGEQGNVIPLVGDWSGKGSDSIGLYDQKSNTFFLKHSNSSGNADWYFQRERTSQNSMPLIGDWDGDGKDTVGFYEPDSETFHLFGSNESTSNISNNPIFKKSIWRNLFSSNTLVVCKKIEFIENSKAKQSNKE